MRDILVFLVVFGSLPFILKRPQIGVLMWVWLGFMNPHRLTWGFAYDFPFSAVVAAFLMVSVVISREPKRMVWSSVTVVWIGFFLWTVLTTIFALFPEDAAIEWSRWWKINLVCLIVLLVMRSQERLHALVWVIVLSLGFYGVKGGVFAIVTAGNHMVFGPHGSFIGDNTAIALALIMTLPLMRYLQLEAKNAWVGRGLVVAMALTVLAIVATQSRGALLGLAGAGVFVVLRSRNWLGIGMAVVVAALFLVSFMPKEWSDRMATIQTYEEDGSAMGRINAWWFAYNLAVDRPLIGGGFRTFQPSLFDKYAPEPEDFHDAHSIYFEVLGEQGFAGLSLFLLLAWMAYKNGNWIRKHAKDNDELRWAINLASMVQVSLVGYAICGAFLGHAYFDYYYSLIAIIVLTRKIVEDELMAARKEFASSRTSEVVAADSSSRGLSC